MNSPKAATVTRLPLYSLVIIFLTSRGLPTQRRGRAPHFDYSFAGGGLSIASTPLATISTMPAQTAADGTSFHSSTP